MKFTNTDEEAGRGCKILCYGQSGAGKTTAIATLPTPLIISAEDGLRPLKGLKLSVLKVASAAEFYDAVRLITESKEAEQFASFAFDSATEIAELILVDELKKTKDPRQAYGELIAKFTEQLRKIRSVPEHVYMAAKVERVQDELNRLLWSPMMPGSKLGPALPYHFDFVFAAQVVTASDGQKAYTLQTGADEKWTAKDRSGLLDFFEYPDLGAIIAKAEGGP